MNPAARVAFVALVGLLAFELVGVGAPATRAIAQLAPTVATFTYDTTVGLSYDPRVFEPDPTGGSCLTPDISILIHHWNYGCGTLAFPESPRNAEFIWRSGVEVYVLRVEIVGHGSPHHAEVIYSGGSSSGTITGGTAISDVYNSVAIVNQYATQLDIKRITTSADPGPFDKDYVTSVSIVYIVGDPTPIPGPTNTPYLFPSPLATWTPPATNTGIPSSRTPVLQTKIAPGLTAVPSLDICANLSNPCGTLAVFPTLDLPSPTVYQIRPTPTPRPITATPPPSATPTQQIGSSLTPAGTPIAMLFTPTSNWIDPLNQLSGAVNQFQATTNALINTGIDNGAGTPTGPIELASQMGAGVAQPILLARVLELTDLNKIGGFISFLIVAIGGSILVEIVSWLLPFAGKFLQFLLLIGQMIMHVIGIIVKIIR